MTQEKAVPVVDVAEDLAWLRERGYHSEKADDDVICNRIAALIEQQAATIAELLEVLTRGRAALQRMMDAWLDYHDAHSLTQPVTGASANAFEDALAARDEADASLAKLRP